MAKDRDELFEHEYDGIQEFDNDLPPWWKNLFYLTIVFSIIYLMYYHVLGIGDSSAVKYNREIDASYQRLPADQGRSLIGYLLPSYHSPYYSPEPDVTDASLHRGLTGGTPVEDDEVIDESVVALMSETDIAGGKEIYDQYCFNCHGGFGEGGIGPNLTDDYWIHGGTFPEIVHTIRKGIPIKGMIAWERSIKPVEVIQVASFLKTLIGTSPPNAKAAQGELFVDSETAE